MKFVAPLLCLGVANAFVLPDAKLFAKVGFEDDQSSLWDKLPSKEDVVSTVKNAADSVTLDSLLEAVDRTSTSVKDSLQEFFEDRFDVDEFDHPHGPPPPDAPPFDGPPFDGPPFDGPPPHDGPPPPGPPSHHGPPPPPGPPPHGPPPHGPPGAPRRGPPRDGPPRDGQPSDGPPPHHGPPHDGPPRGPRRGPPRGPPGGPRGPRGPHRGRGGRHGGHHEHEFNLTIYELISKSKHATKFAKLVDEHEDIVKLLNSTEANYTLFVPVDEAFEHIPDDKKPSKEFIEAVLKYHIGVGLYPARRILASHTLPTAYHESWLDDKPQRLRTSVGLGGLRVNFYSKVIAANIGAKNGVIHAVNHILVPPPMVGKEISLFPSQFSTLLLAYEKTDFVKFIHNVKMSGSTVFAPANGAFAKLGVPANAFLFNTEKGLKYLKALLKYQIVANATLYSDAFYEAGKDKDTHIGKGHTHLDLATLLDDKSIAVDIARWGGFIRMTLNGYVRVFIEDGIAKNGVIQVVDSVPIPPHKHDNDEKALYDGGEISVEELKERLADYVDEEDKKQEDDSSVEL